MASRYEISAVFKMIDNLTAPVKNMESATSRATKKIQADMAKTKMQIKAVGDAMLTAGKLALAAGVALAGKTVIDSVKTYIEFEDAVTKAGSKFKDLDVTSADYQANLEQLQTAAREVGAATMFSATDAAGALDKMAMAGLTSKQSMGMLMGTTNLAVAAGIDLTSAVDMATDAMGAFNLMTDEAGNPLDEKGISDSMNRVADVVAKTTNMANLDMNMWFETVKMGAPTFTSLGGTLEEFSAAAGTLANAGIKGSIAGNALKTMMLRLSAPAKAGSDALNQLGISVFDANGQMRPFLDIMGQFEKNLAGMADEEKASLLKDIFGTETIGSFNVLMAAGTQNLADFTKTLENAGGTADAIANAQMNSFSGMIEQLKSAWQDKQLSIGKAFETGGAKEALQSLITYVQTLDITPIVSFLQSVMEALPSIVSNVGSVISFIWGIKDAIFAVMAGVAAYKTVMVALVAIQTTRNALALVGIGQTTAMTAATVAQTAATGAQAAATGAATTAQTGLNVAMSANPIGLIIMAVAALAFGIYELVKHFDDVKAFFIWLWDYAVASFNNAMTVIGNFFSWVWEKLTWLGSVIGDFFSGVWDSLVSWNAMIVEKVLGFFSWIWEKIVGIGESIGGVFSSIWGGISGFFSGMIEGVKNVGKNILSFLISPVIKALDLMSGIPGIGDWIGGKRDALIAFQNSLTGNIVESNTPQTNQLGSDFNYYKSLGWDDDEIPATAPVSQGERTAYSVTESNNNTSTEVTVTLDKGLQGSVSRPAPNVTVQNTRSGSW